MREIVIIISTISKPSGDSFAMTMYPSLGEICNVLSYIILIHVNYTTKDNLIEW